MNHLLILHQPYLDLILSGKKTVESRLSQRRHPAATRLHAGDQLYFKVKGGDILARARAGAVIENELRTPEDIQQLFRTWAGRLAVTAESDYWQAKQHARHALLVELLDVEQFRIPAAHLPRRLAWASAWIAGHPTADIITNSNRTL